MKSKNLIEKQTRKKTNKSLIDMIIFLKKNGKWKKVAEKLSGPKRKEKIINLSDLNKITKDGEKVLFIGKVLSKGEINKKIIIIGLDFSSKAKEKLLKSGCKFLKIYDEALKNPKMEGIKIINENN